MVFTLEAEQEEDGRWLAAVPELPGVLAYGWTPQGAISRAQALALRVLADRIEHEETIPGLINISFQPVILSTAKDQSPGPDPGTVG